MRAVTRAVHRIAVGLRRAYGHVGTGRVVRVAGQVGAAGDFRVGRERGAGEGLAGVVAVAAEVAVDVVEAGVDEADLDVLAGGAERRGGAPDVGAADERHARRVRARHDRQRLDRLDAGDFADGVELRRVDIDGDAVEEPLHGEEDGRGGDGVDLRDDALLLRVDNGDLVPRRRDGRAQCPRARLAGGSGVQIALDGRRRGELDDDGNALLRDRGGRRQQKQREQTLTHGWTLRK